MGQDCSKRFKQNEIVYSQESAYRAYKAYERRLKEMHDMKV